MNLLELLVEHDLDILHLLVNYILVIAVDQASILLKHDLIDLLSRLEQAYGSLSPQQYILLLLSQSVHSELSICLGKSDLQYESDIGK